MPHTVLERRTFSSYKNRKLKVKTVMSQSSRKKRRVYFVPFIFCPKGISLRFAFYLNVQCIEYTFRLYILLQFIEYAFRVYILSHIKKHYFIHFCSFFQKLSKAFAVSLKWLNQNLCNLLFQAIQYLNIQYLLIVLFCVFLNSKTFSA